MNNTEKLVAALATPAQALEDALWQLLVQRTVDTAIGVQLDVIGRVVGQSRDGLGDDSYRRYIRARISVNRSRGTLGDLLGVAKLVLLGVTGARFEVETQTIATVVVRVPDIALADSIRDTLLYFLRLAKVAGVRVIVETNEEAPATSFTTETCTFLATGVSIGGTFFDPVGDSDNFRFPTTGYLTLDYGSAGAETVPYEVRFPSTRFFLPTGSTFAAAHTADAIAVLTTSGGADLSPGLGWGDTSTPATGGALAAAAG